MKSWLCSFYLLFAVLFSAFAQKKSGYTTKKITSENMYESMTITDYGIDFKNLNVIFFYEDAKKLAKINELEKKSASIKELLPVIEDYVSNFGIRNFYMDTDLLWKLAQLYEQNGQLAKAKAMYRLVLKHHRKSLDKIIQYYDSLTVLEQNYYVPLDYYYQLVEYRKSVDTLRPPREVFLNMGDALNSKFADYAPTITTDKNIIIFTTRRDRLPNSKFRNENLYYSKNEDGFWGFAEPLEEVNSLYNEGSAAISPDGKTLVLTRCNTPDGFGNCDLYISTLQDDSTWATPKNLGPAINGKAWDSHPSLSPGGDTLYFASDRLGGFGLSDIYYSVKVNGIWTKAKNIGPIINTRDNEVSPFLHPRHKVLYFSSNGHLVNFGSYDIFKSNYRKGHWQEPKNIGPLVNTEGSEYYFTIDVDSKRLYYARSEPDDLDNLDLYSFALPMEAQPLATTVFKGTLADSAGNVYKGIVSVIDLQDGIEVAPKALRPDGSFEFDLIKDKKYLLVVQGDDFFRIEKIFELDGDTNISLEAKPVNKLITFASIEFEEGKANILPAMEQDLQHIIDFLIDHPTFNLRIAGHTDLQGDKKKNLALSQRRADSIKKFLITKGKLAEERIEAIGFGDTQPLVEEKTEADRRINRRVEFEIKRN
jgi:outer membrane protein OmpA-like peptidoglycan-associated protein